MDTKLLQLQEAVDSVLNTEIQAIYECVHAVKTEKQKGQTHIENCL